MAAENELNLLRLLQGHHKIGVFFPGHAEDVLHPFFLKALHEQI